MKLLKAKREVPGAAERQKTLAAQDGKCALCGCILEQYRGVFERIYIFSPSIDIDDGWIPVKKYIEQDLGVNTEREQAYWDEWDEGAAPHHPAAAQDHRGVQEVGDEETVSGPDNL